MPATSSRPGRVRSADRLHRATLRLLRRLRSVDRESGIGPARLSALSVLVYGGVRSVGDLAEIEQVRPPTMTRIVRGLVDEGLARARPDPGDARVSRVQATAKGRRVMERGRRRRNAELSGMLAGLDTAELAVIDRAAVLISAMLERPLLDRLTR